MKYESSFCNYCKKQKLLIQNLTDGQYDYRCSECGSIINLHPLKLQIDTTNNLQESLIAVRFKIVEARLSVAMDTNFTTRESYEANYTNLIPTTLISGFWIMLASTFGGGWAVFFVLLTLLTMWVGWNFSKAGEIVSLNKPILDSLRKVLHTCNVTDLQTISDATPFIKFAKLEPTVLDWQYKLSELIQYDLALKLNAEDLHNIKYKEIMNEPNSDPLKATKEAKHWANSHPNKINAYFPGVLTREEVENWDMENPLYELIPKDLTNEEKTLRGMRKVLAQPYILKKRETK